MSARIPLAPIVEEIANRWGFFGLETGPAAPVQLTEDSLAGFQFYGEKLQLSDILGLLPSGVKDRGNSVAFPLTVELSQAAEWRERHSAA